MTLGRQAAFDNLRGFVIVLVVCHHAILAYCTFGHFNPTHYLLSTAPVVDPERWFGFDLLVLINDSFFMSLMFLLSGLFVWRSLVRKGPWQYCRDRLIRLGLPFAIAVLTLVPLAYYPSFRLTGSQISLGAFWVTMVSNGPWPSGPAWFVGLLLLFDSAAVLLFVALGHRDSDRGSPSGYGATAYFGTLVALSTVFYLPLLVWFGPMRWLSVGPMAVQASRIGLYMLYFGSGVVIGAQALGPDANVFGPDFVRHWTRWSLLAASFGAVLVAFRLGWFRNRILLPTWLVPSFYGFALITFCAAACFALLALFLRFDRRRTAVWESLAGNAYGIYLLHYPVVTWIQYYLLETSLGAVPKAIVVFVTALSLSWGTTSVLRRMPGAVGVV